MKWAVFAEEVVSLVKGRGQLSQKEDMDHHEKILLKIASLSER